MTESGTVYYEEHRTLRSDLWRRFRRHRGAVSGLILLGVIVLLCLVGPLLWPGDGFLPDTANANRTPSWAHPMGTDNLGRDVFARVMVGGRVSLGVGVTAMLVSVFIGTGVGVLAGYFRKVDGALMRVTELFMALPILPLLLVVMMLFRVPLTEMLGPRTGMFVLVVVTVGMTSWMTTARVVRSQVLRVKQEEFIVAAHGMGAKGSSIVFRHIVPNVLSPVIVAAAIGVASAIIAESALSFLGLGFPPNLPTWGRLLYDSKDYLPTNPMRVIWPGLLISLTVISVNFIGDGMRDALDPKTRRR